MEGSFTGLDFILRRMEKDIEGFMQARVVICLHQYKMCGNELQRSRSESGNTNEEEEESKPRGTGEK